MIGTKLAHYEITSHLGSGGMGDVYQATDAKLELRFSDCVFMRPGDYILWFGLYDAQTTLQNVVKRRIRVPELQDNLLPNLNASLPPAEFPPIIRTDPNSVQTLPGPLFLPVSNKQPVRVELISIATPPDQWADRIDVIRSYNNRIIAAVGALSQMKLANGSMSAKAFDLISGQVPFEQQNVLQLDWKGFAGTFTRLVDSHKVSTLTLQTEKDRSEFFRDSLQQHLDTPSETLRVLIVVSGSLLFERGSNLDPLKLTRDCQCRVYHLRFRLNKNDLFDDLEKLMKPLRHKTFNITSAIDLRRAIARIIQDLESL